MIFTETKRGADELTRRMRRDGWVNFHVLLLILMLLLSQTDDEFHFLTWDHVNVDNFEFLVAEVCAKHQYLDFFCHIYILKVNTFSSFVFQLASNVYSWW